MVLEEVHGPDRTQPHTAANREFVTVADLQAFLDDQGKELPGDFREIRFGDPDFVWGDDDEIQVEGRSPIRKLGIGGRLWVDESIAAFTRSTPTMEALLAGCSGAEPTLASDEAFAGIAQRLDEFDGAFNATLTDQVRGSGDLDAFGEPGGTEPGSDDAGPLEGVTAYGYASGPSDDPDEARIRLVLASGSKAEATANADQFVDRVDAGLRSVSGEPWSELLRVEDAEADGRFVIVELRAENASILDNDLFRRDSLVVSD